MKIKTRFRPYNPEQLLLLPQNMKAETLRALAGLKKALQGRPEGLA